MRAKIHRGATEIGGSCVELEAQGQRLVLDLGRPLWAAEGEEVVLPEIPGLVGARDPSLKGVVISHGHPDHYGLIDQLADHVPVFAGEATAKILSEAAFFSPHGRALSPSGHLANAQELRLGPFTITPYLVDHSAFDAYALLVEADARSLFYSGDIRAHGRKPRTFERLIEDPPEADVLLMEGTTLSRNGADQSPASEAEVTEASTHLFQETEGMVLACYSAQNIDRYVSIYRAALQANRDLVIDLYTAAIAAASGRETIPQASWDRVKVYVPLSQRVKVKEAEEFERVNAIAQSRIFPEDLKDQAGQLVMTFRPSMARELERAGCLAKATALWSMWPGYLDEPGSERLKSFLATQQIPLSVIHASGHASVADLQRLAAAFKTERIVPIHTATPEKYAEVFGTAEPHRDDRWWEV